MKKKFVVGLAFLTIVSLPSILMAEGDPNGKADVVESGGFLGLTGHNSLWDGSKLLEVRTGASGINNTCVYNNRKLSDVKGWGYKGARYDNKASSANLLKVLDKAKNQSNYKATYSLLKPSLKYAITSENAWVLNFNTSKLEQKKVKSPSVLRCDFLVSASYKEAGGKDLSGYPHDPEAVWGRLPKGR